MVHQWTSHEDGRRILMSAGLITDLRAAAIEGFVSLPKRGVEVGGILFGETRSGALQIEGFEEIPCEHRYGPSYALSETDRERLANLLAVHRGSDSLAVVGFYRSFTSRDPIIEAADEQFVQDHFPGGTFLFLMLQPLAPDRCLASFRFFHDGKLLPESELPPFVFDAAHMQPVESPTSQPVAHSDADPAPIPDAEAAAATAASAPFPVLPPAYRRERAPRWAEETQEAPPPRRTRWWLPVAICLVAGVGGAAVYELWRVAREPRWAELHLDAKPAGSQLEITWDTAAARAAAATRGILAVNDGAAHRSVELTPDQLRAGRYSYTPEHGDIALRLILYGKTLAAVGDAVRIQAIPALAQGPAKPLPNEADRAAEPAPDTPKSNVAQPPTATLEAQPRIPAGIRSRLQERITIPVEVQVNRQGRVTSARVQETSTDGLRRYLETEAQKTARQWRFNPAKSKTGTRVAAKTTVYVAFNP